VALANPFSDLCLALLNLHGKRKTMKTNWILMLLLALGLICTATLVARADDKDKDEENEKVTSLDKIPAAAKDALMKAVGTNTIDKVLEGSKDGKTYYEAQYKDGDKKMEVQVNAAGNIVKQPHEEKDEDKDKDKDKK